MRTHRLLACSSVVVALLVASGCKKTDVALVKDDTSAAAGARTPAADVAGECKVPQNVQSIATEGTPATDPNVSLGTLTQRISGDGTKIESLGDAKLMPSTSLGTAKGGLDGPGSKMEDKAINKGKVGKDASAGTEYGGGDIVETKKAGNGLRLSDTDMAKVKTCGADETDPNAYVDDVRDSAFAMLDCTADVIDIFAKELDEGLGLAGTDPSTFDKPPALDKDKLKALIDDLRKAQPPIYTEAELKEFEKFGKEEYYERENELKDTLDPAGADVAAADTNLSRAPAEYRNYQGDKSDEKPIASNVDGRAFAARVAAKIPAPTTCTTEDANGGGAVNGASLNGDDDDQEQGPGGGNFWGPQSGQFGLKVGFDGKAFAGGSDKKKPKGIGMKARLYSDIKLFGHEVKNMAWADATGHVLSPKKKSEIKITANIHKFKIFEYKKEFGEAKKKQDKADKKPKGAFQQLLSKLNKEVDGRYRFVVGPVPLAVRWYVGTEFSYAWNIAFTNKSDVDITADLFNNEADVASKLNVGLYGDFTPAFAGYVGLEAMLDLAAVRGGVGGKLTMLELGPTFQAKVTFNKDKGLKHSVLASLKYNYLAGKLYAFVEHWYPGKWKRYTLELAQFAGMEGVWDVVKLPADEQPTAFAPGSEADEILQGYLKDATEQQRLAGVEQARKDREARGFTISSGQTILPARADWCIDLHPDAAYRPYEWGVRSNREIGNNSRAAYMSPCHGGANQRFRWDASDRALHMTYDNKEYCLDLAPGESSARVSNGGSGPYGYLVYMNQDCHGGKNQKWSFYESGAICSDDPSYNNICLDFHAGRKIGGGFMMHGWSHHGNYNQIWYKKYD